MGEKMSLEQVKAEMWEHMGHGFPRAEDDDMQRWIDAIDAHLTQPAQAAQGETACPKCGATNPENAATRCRPDGDSCPGCEDPLAQAWDRKAARPAQPVDVEKVRRVSADIRHWNEAICHPALNVFANELEAAIKGVAP